MLASTALKERFCAVILIASLLTLKISLVLTSHQQAPCDLSPRKAISIVGAINETDEGAFPRFGRERGQAKVPGVCFLPGSNKTEALFGGEIPGAVPSHHVARAAKSYAAEEDISFIPHPNTVSRK